MKKLLKFGVTSLTLATLGVLTSVSDGAALGTQTVYAEENQPLVTLDQTSIEAQASLDEAGGDTVTSLESTPGSASNLSADGSVIPADVSPAADAFGTRAVADDNRPISISIHQSDEQGHYIRYRGEYEQSLSLNPGETKVVSAPTIPDYVSDRSEVSFYTADGYVERAGSGAVTLSYDDLKKAGYGVSVQFYYRRAAASAQTVQTTPITIHYLNGLVLNETLADKIGSFDVATFSDAQLKEGQLRVPEVVEATWTDKGYVLNTTLKTIDGYRLQYWRKVGGMKLHGPLAELGGDGSTISTEVKVSDDAEWEYYAIEAFYVPIETPLDKRAPSPTELGSKRLDSSQAPVAVTVSGADSATIAAIETSRVTDQAILAKLPASLPQADTILYDIKTVDDKGNFVQITEPATVTLAVDPSRQVGKVFYFLPETGMIEELDFSRSTDQKTVSFTVTHFSQYGVVYETVSSQNQPAAPNTKGQVTNPEQPKAKDSVANPEKPKAKDPITQSDKAKTQTSSGKLTSPQAGKEELAITRNQLLAQVDKSSLTDAQKGELAVKITFAETAEELDKIKAELTRLTVPAAKPASVDSPAETSTKTLPATGDSPTETLVAMGLTLLLASLGLSKIRKTV